MKGPDPGRSGEIWVVGAGRVGAVAASRLSRLRRSRMLVLDIDPDALAPIADSGIDTRAVDGIAFLARELQPDGGPDYILPALPRHLAFEWLRLRLGGAVRPVAVPPRVANRLPNAYPTTDGGWAASHADFVCPMDCPEPANACPVTGRPRPALFREIERLAAPAALVVRSRQMAPGLGALRRGDLIAAERRLQAFSGAMVVATSCRCHAVVHALETT